MTNSHGQLMRSYIDILNENEMQNMKWDEISSKRRDARSQPNLYYQRYDNGDYQGMVKWDLKGMIMSVSVKKLNGKVLRIDANGNFITSNALNAIKSEDTEFDEILAQAQTLYDQVKLEDATNVKNNKTKSF